MIATVVSKLFYLEVKLHLNKKTIFLGAKTSFDKNFKKHSKREIPALKESLESADTRSSYLEENDNSLYGSDTPIFMARRNKSVEDPESPYYIEYHQKPFVSDDQISFHYYSTKISKKKKLQDFISK